jgi:hypothetical protein
MMKASKSNPADKPNMFLPLALLAGVLIALFWRSLLPGYVHFSNDGPLGQQMVMYSYLPGAFMGCWGDLNDIGFNGGAYTPSLSMLFFWAVGPVGFAKFSAPFALLILGAGAWTFFRKLKFSPPVATLGALAAMLNSTFLSNACWGVASQEIALGMDFFALALLVSNSSATPAVIRWARLALAGLCVGVNVMEAADIGAIFSLFVSAFVLLKIFADESGPVLVRLSRGIGRIAFIAAFACFIATSTIISLVSTQIQGVEGADQKTEGKTQGSNAMGWDWATQWSLPKAETFSLLVPGLFGYKMDTPNNMPDFLQDYYKGGVYWGGMGRSPEIDRFFDSGQPGSPPSGPDKIMRFSGGQNYPGIVVVVIALWAIAQSLRRKDSVFAEGQRRHIWFWGVLLAGSLLLAYGRFAPFYKLFYALPHASSIRNPTKFLIVFNWIIVILFGYGVHGLSQRFLMVSAAGANSISNQLKNWWARVLGFDRKWTFVCGVCVAASVLGWLVYASEKPALITYLQKVGYGDEEMAKQIATFSITQAGLFVPLLAATVGLTILIIAGIFSGKRAKLGGILLGALLVIDLGRADLPFITHWNYIQKYDVDSGNPSQSTNPIINFLRDKPYEHRVAGLPFHAPEGLELFDELYRIEWVQHHFLYYQIQTLDIIQMPRPPADLSAYEMALAFRGTPETMHLITRRWELTNTRYLLGPAGYLDVMNSQLDPAQHRFRILQRFNVVAKPGVAQPTQLSEMTTTPGDNGNYALFEFTGALPRVKLYCNWQTVTNDQAVLKTLASPNFDPAGTVLVDTPSASLPAMATNANSGTVEFESYSSRKIDFTANAAAPSVLLLNDHYDPNWRVTVDGKPAELLRCNFIMRGVYLPAGQHTVEFQFSLPNPPLYITLAAMGLGVLLCGFLFVEGRKTIAVQP